MADILAHPLIRQAYELCLEIEKLPASEQQTITISKASALLEALAELTDLRRTGLTTTELQQAEGREAREGRVVFVRQTTGVVVSVYGVAVANIPTNLWVSDVLNMTAFGERPGDWQTFMLHHSGQQDMLKGRRGGY